MAPRQTGKTTFMQQIINNLHYDELYTYSRIYITLEDLVALEKTELYSQIGRKIIDSLKNEFEFYSRPVSLPEVPTYESIYGQQIIPIDGEYMVFIACEYCNGLQININKLCCAKCGGPLDRQGAHLTRTVPDQATPESISAQILEFIYEQKKLI